MSYADGTRRTAKRTYRWGVLHTMTNKLLASHMQLGLMVDSLIYQVSVGFEFLAANGLR